MGLSVTPGGLFTAGSKVSVWNGSAFVPAQAVSVWDGDSFTKVWSQSNITIKTFTASLGTPPQSQIKLIWSAPGALRFRLWRDDAGTGTKLYEGGGYDFTDTRPSGTKTRYTLEAAISGTAGAYVWIAKAISVTTASAASPEDLRITTNNWDTQTLTWDAVAGAIGYELHRTAPTTATVSLGVTTSYKTTGTAEKTSYSWKVRAKTGATTFSGYSNTLTYKSAAKPGPKPGVYTFKPTGNDSWRAAKKAWRPEAEMLYHGNGSAYGSTYGTETTFFYYGANRFDALEGAKITKIEVFISRTATSVGLAGEVACHWLLHPHTARPSGVPTFGALAVDAGSLKRGEGSWVTLPVAWATALITNTTYRGLAWGNVSTPTRYMCCNPSLTGVGGNPATGTLRITVG